MLIIPAPVYSLAQAAWIPRLTIGVITGRCANAERPSCRVAFRGGHGDLYSRRRRKATVRAVNCAHWRRKGDYDTKTR